MGNNRISMEDPVLVLTQEQLEQILTDFTRRIVEILPTAFMHAVAPLKLEINELDAKVDKMWLSIMRSLS